VRIVCDATLAFIKRCNVLSAIIKMADFCEQRACTKFCFKLEKTATECYKILKTAFWKKLWVVPKHFSGFPGLRQAELRLMMNNALVEQCPVQRQKLLRECVRLSARTVVVPLMKSVC